MNLIYAKDPTWANRSQTSINLIARFKEIEEDLPFTADPNDTEAHGREIYARAVEGQFGAIGPFISEPPLIDEVKKLIRQARDFKLKTEVDPIVSNPLRWADLSSEKQYAWADYRIALLAFPDDPVFPWYNLVVSETDYGYTTEVSKAPWPQKP
jgi:hypothetical protein